MATPISNETYYKGYDDPAADMVLEVKDGVKFRVHSYLLKAHSQFFRSMPDYDKDLCGTSSRVIQIEAEPAVFALLLNMIDNRVSDSKRSWSDYEGMIELGVRYEFMHLVPLFIGHAESHKPGGSPWRMFVTASTYDIPVLARRALADFHSSHLWCQKSVAIKPKDMRELSGKYATAFVLALRRSAEDDLPSRRVLGGFGRAGDGQANNWLAISGTFNPEACA